MKALSSPAGGVATRRSLCWLLLAAAVVAEGLGGRGRSAEAFAASVRPALSAHPNIVVIITDDLDVASLNRLIALGFMPNLNDVVIRRGSTFANSFVTNSICGPSRATFLTGQYAHNHHVRTNVEPGGSVTALDDTSTIATWLHAGGYRTGLVGKYINGYGITDVNHDGVTDMQDVRYIPPGWDHWQSLFEPSEGWMYHYATNDNGNIVIAGNNPEDYLTDVLARRASDFIAQSQAQAPGTPLFLLLATSAPHCEVPTNLNVTKYSDLWPLTIRPAPRHVGTVTATLPPVPSTNEADVSDKPAWFLDKRPLMTDTDLAYNRQKYQARLTAMRAVDDLIGTVADALRQAGRFDDTVIIFTSDNGYHFGEHRLGEKSDGYEEALRVPLYVAGGGYPVQSLSQFVVNTDLAPTIADLAGVTPGRPVDGRSFTPLLQNASLAWRKRFLVEHVYPDGSKMCLTRPDVCAALEIASYTGVRSAPSARYVPSQVYLEYDDGLASKEFYDFAVDPYELTSLHGDTSDQRVLQKSIHQQWLSLLKNCGSGTCQNYEFF